MVRGIDISHFQGVIDWAAVAASEIRFCYIKATEGAGNVDPRFAKNWPHARAAGLVRGAYHFFHPAASPAAQADSFVRTVGRLVPGDLPPVLDLEAPAEWAGIMPGERTALALQWLDSVEERFGIRPVVYLSPAFATEILENAPQLCRYPVWLAHYTNAAVPSIPKPWNSWTFWQYTGAGQTAGVKAPVDLDRFNGSQDELVALTRS